MKSALHQIGKTSLAAALSGAVLLSAQTTHAAALSVSQQPLMLIQGVAPEHAGDSRRLGQYGLCLCTG